MDLSKLGEFGWIERIRARQGKIRPSHGLKLGIGDDCAVFDPGGGYQLLTTDALIEDVHFRLATTSPEDLGRKSLAVNLSDIAAMGGKPTLAFLSIGIPRNTRLAFLDKLLAGLYAEARRYKVILAGGDTVSSPGPLVINIALLGQPLRRNRIFTRRGARMGDKIWVTGTLGESALGLWLLEKSGKTARNIKPADRRRLTARHLSPTPRLKEAALLAESTIHVSSMIDISDGFLQDLGHLLEQDRLGAIINRSALPESSTLHRVCHHNNLNSLDFILSGGEDYELLFTSPGKDARKVLAQFKRAALPVSLVGEITGNRGEIRLVDGGKPGREIKLSSRLSGTGYDHFKKC